MNTREQLTDEQCRGYLCDASSIYEMMRAIYEAGKAASDADAERYRWLRDYKGTDGIPFICVYKGSFSQLTVENADKAIDAAMKD
jgi:hypothetical protein